MKQSSPYMSYIVLGLPAAALLCALTIIFVSTLIMGIEYPDPMPKLIVMESIRCRTVTVRNEDILIPGNKTLAVATLILNKERFVEEWVAFHIVMGFQFFMIFDHGSTDQARTLLSPYIRSGHVILIHARETFRACGERPPGTQHVQAVCQKAVFNYAMQKLKGIIPWMGTFDIDEFVWTHPNKPTVDKLLQSEYSSYSWLHIPGIVFGHNNISDFLDENKLVILTHTKRSNTAGFMWSKYDEDRYTRKNIFRTDHAISVGVHSINCACMSEKFLTPLASNIRMNHYRFISKTEQHKKAISNANQHMDSNEERDAMVNEIEDTEIHYIVPQLESTVQMFRNTRYADDDDNNNC